MPWLVASLIYGRSQFIEYRAHNCGSVHVLQTNVLDSSPKRTLLAGDAWPVPGTGNQFTRECVWGNLAGRIEDKEHKVLFDCP